MALWPVHIRYREMRKRFGLSGMVKLAGAGGGGTRW